MHTVAATSDELDAMRRCRDVQKQSLKQLSFFSFSAKRWYREKISELDVLLDEGTLTERVLDVPGFKVRTSNWDDSKRCFYTEINGLICEIDEFVHRECLHLQQSTRPRVTIREFPNGELCTAIIIAADLDEMEDISDDLSDQVPARSVFPGNYQTIVADINACTEGLWPHEYPEYVDDDVAWFHVHDDQARFAAAWLDS